MIDMTNKEALKRTIGKILIVIAAATFVAGLLSSVMGAPIAKWLYFVSLIAGGAPVAASAVQSVVEQKI